MTWLERLLNTVLTITKQLGVSVLFTAVGLVLLAITFLILKKVIPFSIRKEIEEDQNVALGIVLASVILGVSIIVAAAVHGG